MLACKHYIFIYFIFIVNIISRKSQLLTFAWMTNLVLFQIEMTPSLPYKHRKVDKCFNSHVHFFWLWIVSSAKLFSCLSFSNFLISWIFWDISSRKEMKKNCFPWSTTVIIFRINQQRYLKFSDQMTYWCIGSKEDAVSGSRN